MKTIGRYIVRGLLGRGGMGKIYKVELPIIGRIAALKLLDPDPLVEQLMGKETIRSLFEKEAVTMAGLNHPNIVSIHDYDQDRGKRFYVMDFYANNLGTMMGESYTVESPSRPIPVDRAIGYTRQYLEGIRCLHDAGIVHRDIKPFNLLVTPRDTVKICDFGLSKLRGETDAGPGNLKVGSPYYAAPEQEQDPNSVDERADLYPVGVMLYRMLTGRLPAINPDQSAYRPVASYRPDLDQHWDTFIQQAAAYKPAQRFTDAKAMRDALNQLDEHWQAKKEKSCRLPAEAAPSAIESLPATVRKEPLKCPPDKAARRFGVDTLWRPKVYHPGLFQDQKNGSILDQATGLRWQQSGSDYPQTWSMARKYIRHLNRTVPAGHAPWRLPTVEELMTLLRPVPRGRDLCIAPLFDATQRWLWSADRRSYMAGYYVDVELGFVGWQDFSALFYVRAVCSETE